MNPFLMKIEEANKDKPSREIKIKEKSIEEVFLKPIRTEFRKY